MHLQEIQVTNVFAVWGVDLVVMASAPEAGAGEGGVW